MDNSRDLTTPVDTAHLDLLQQLHTDKLSHMEHSAVVVDVAADGASQGSFIDAISSENDISSQFGGSEYNFETHGGANKPQPPESPVPTFAAIPNSKQRRPTSANESTTPNAEPTKDTIDTKNEGYIYTPFEQSTFLPDTSFPASPFTTPLPKQTVAIVGGGLAGLSAAVEAVDQFYYRFEGLMKRFADDLGAGSFEKVLENVATMDLGQLHDYLSRDQIFETFIHNLAHFRVFILEKEKSVGGNSMKASSGINAIGSDNQRDWFLWMHKRNPTEVDKRPGFYNDSIASFFNDTMQSAVSPEPPLWKPIQETEPQVSDGTQSHGVVQILKPISPYTTKMIKNSLLDSRNAIPFLEQRQIPDIIGKFVTLLHKRYYPTFPDKLPQTGSLRQPPRVFKLFLTRFVQLGGHSHPRTHRPGPPGIGDHPSAPLPPIGAATIASLSSRLADFPYNLHIQVITGAKLVGLTYPSEQTLGATMSPNVLQAAIKSGKHQQYVNGLLYQVMPTLNNSNNREQHNLPADVGKTFQLPATAVVITTGGFSASTELIQKYSPRLAELNLPTTNGAWATGDAVPIALEAGGTTVGMDQIQVHPTSFVDPTNIGSKVNFLAPEALRGSGGLLLNFAGERFINELGTRDIVSRAIYWQEHHASYLILSETCAIEFGEAMNFYLSKGLYRGTFEYLPVIPAGRSKPYHKISIGELDEKQQRNLSDNEFEFNRLLDEIFGPDAQFSPRIRQQIVINVDQAIRGLIPLNPDQIHPKISPTMIFNIQTTTQTYHLVDLVAQMLFLSRPYHQTPYFNMGHFNNVLLTTLSTLANYSALTSPTQDSFNRPSLQNQDSFNLSNRFFVGVVTPAIHFTMGGLATDFHGRVVQREYFEARKNEWEREIYQHSARVKGDEYYTTKESIIRAMVYAHHESPQRIPTVSGLYAAGEASGGFHGRNRLGGNSLMECVTMGKAVAKHIVSNELFHDPQIPATPAQQAKFDGQFMPQAKKQLYVWENQNGEQFAYHLDENGKAVWFDFEAALKEQKRLEQEALERDEVIHLDGDKNLLEALLHLNFDNRG
jgi:succinate dehydrogenase/fumarate reductase flavoprotein subunit